MSVEENRNCGCEDKTNNILTEMKDQDCNMNSCETRREMIGKIRNFLYLNLYFEK